MSRPGTRRFACRGGAAGSAFRPHRLTRRGGTRGRGTVRGGASGLARERAPRHGAVRFALEHPRYRPRDARPAVGFALVLARGIGICGASARARLGLPFLGGRSATPARLAFDSPMAMACCGDRAPCSPRRILRISSCTNSPAWVLGAFPARLSLRAFAIVRFSGIIILPYGPFPSATRIPRGAVALAWAPSPMVSTLVLSI